MPDLASLTDYDPVVDQPFVVADPSRRVPVYKDDDPSVDNSNDNANNDIYTKPSKTSVAINNVLNKLFRDDDQRYQLWPEKVVRSALTAIPDAYSGKLPTVEDMIPRALDMASFAGTGGLGGITDATLGATPFLRPALKYKDKLYKGKEGQQHMDVIPEHLYPKFQDMAMKGEDISHYNFGFVNDKGQFLSREKALEYGINTGLIDPQAGKFGALTSTLMADSTKPGMAIEAMAKAKPFFSAVEHNVNAIPQTKMNGEAWLGTLSNKPGVKPEELDWTGLKSFLEENKGKPVTKEQIQEHLAQNKVDVQDVVKGEPPAWEELSAGDRRGIRDRMLDNDPNGEMYDNPQTFYNYIRENYPQDLDLTGAYNNTKYHSYQLPGGENYREMLLTLPDRQAQLEGFDKVGRLTQAETKELIELQRKNGVSGRENYRSSHWDEPNILAHVRMNDRWMDDPSNRSNVHPGKVKSLHLEEIQSDWHQQGRDKGYSNPKEIETRQNELKKQLDEVVTERAKLAGAKSPEDRAKYQAAHEKEAALIDEYNNLHNKKAYGVPDAPFKKSWHELALKRMIREAAEKGYSRLSWTPGEAQAARYDLSKQIDRIQYHADKQRLVAQDKNGSVVLDKDIPPEKIADFVGKDVAKKLLDEKNKSFTGLPIHTLENADLKIGGEGMKGFYDQIIPKALEKIGKEHGVKVKQETINKIDKNKLYDDLIKEGYDPGNAEDMVARLATRKGSGNDVIHYIDIPQSLKNTAMHKGFPLFSSTHMFIPVDHDPFEKKK